MPSRSRSTSARALDGDVARWVVVQEPARQAHRADVDRAHPGRPVAPRPDGDLGGASADVADGDQPARGPPRRRGCAEECEPPFLDRGEQPHRHSRCGSKAVEQLVAVRGLPAGARDEHLEPADAEAAGLLDEARDAVRRLGELRLRDRPEPLDRLAEPEHGLLPGQGFPVAGDVEPDRVRTHVDDAYGHGSMMTKPDVGALMPSPSAASPAPHADDLGRTAALALLRPDALPRAVRAEAPRLRVVVQERPEDRLDLGAHLRSLGRHDHLDPVVEVARHQVGAPDQVGLLLAGLEAEEAAVLEEAAEDRAHADPVAQALDAGAQHADRAHDQVDLGARLRGAVELLDDRRGRSGC